jgi:hypothetical protein
MKKALIIFLMVGAVIVMSSVAIAALDEKTIPITANVAKYAKITVLRTPMNIGNFTGMPNQELPLLGIPADNAVFNVETNTTLTLTFSGGDLKKDTSTLVTAYAARQVDDSLDYGFFNRDRINNYAYVGDLIISAGQLPMTTKTYECLGWAKTGPNISSQEAGSYSATITLTVSAP